MIRLSMVSLPLPPPPNGWCAPDDPPPPVFPFFPPTLDAEPVIRGNVFRFIHVIPVYIPFAKIDLFDSPGFTIRYRTPAFVLGPYLK